MDAANKKEQTTLFEVSWEVCNKVGGIYAVVSTKVLEAVAHFGDNYYLLGPDTGKNAEFEETIEPCWESLKGALAVRNISCRFGRWQIPGRPKVILVNVNDRYDKNQLLAELWTRYGVDSLAGGWDYLEPLMFSYACGEVIAAATETIAKPTEGRVVAQFHEWMCGGGLLAIKKLEPRVGTVFTTHATMLGRAMAGSGFDIYKQMYQINPKQEAGAYSITSKCSMEVASAREADCFTTVSNITADEATVFLGRKPDIVTPNGLDLSVIPDFSKERELAGKHRKSVFEACGRLLRSPIPENTRVFLISGRYEYHNKGIDVFMEALAGANDALRNSDKTILAIAAVMGGHSGVNPDAVGGDPNKRPDDGNHFICSHYAYNPAFDPILKNCKRLGLTNNPEDPVKFVFIPAQLNGVDGFLNMPYYDIMSACHLGIFPSWYEPWGYTPQESAALAVPTVTTDLSGFGHWVRDLKGDNIDKSGVSIVQRRQTSYQATVQSIKEIVLEYACAERGGVQSRREAVRAMMHECSWQKFFAHYTTAYELASNRARARSEDQGIHSANVVSRLQSSNSLTAPVLRSFTSVVELPPAISRLREIAYNIWWYWNPNAWNLFSNINPVVWQESRNNPVYTIDTSTNEQMAALAADPMFLQIYGTVIREFDAYMKERPNEYGDLTPQNPVAYFSMEYGLSSCLPIYSGGLGVLSGDHLKSASDLNIPLVAVGLLYRCGYFRQQLDKEGRQIALYPENDFTTMPIKRVLDKNGDPLDLEMDLPNRKLYAQIWEVQVGRIKLYLMDTDTPKNTPDDRKITARLYEADRDYRLRQEILLGIGGIRMLRMLGITPSVHHMNEGHSAFLILERIRLLMHEKKLAFAEAAELVRGGNLFTTHTPVEAGNEHFTVDRMETYFMPFAQELGLSWQEFLRLGKIDGSERNVFEMTLLALNNSSKSNGVSAMHGVVSRYMWQKNWRGVPTIEVPIGHVTNGIHVPSYIGPAMKALWDGHLGEGWQNKSINSAIWKRVANIPDNQFWGARIIQKNNLLEVIRESMPMTFKKYGISGSRQKEMLSSLTPNALIFGFARRFAPYKRATLLFADPDRLASIIANATQPVLFVFSGKAHPADVQGADLIQDVIRYMLDPRFFGHVFFLEDYSLEVSRHLSQGCDVWLNNPRRPLEASGTSGQKVPVNGGINCSVSDGWWCEGYNGANGWTVGPVLKGDKLPVAQNDYDDAEAMYDLLEKTIIPLYCDTGGMNIPNRWIKVAKESMASLTALYSSNRMVYEYLTDYYIPASKRNKELTAENMALARRLAAWKKDITSRFNLIKIEDVSVDGLVRGKLHDTDRLAFKVRVHLAGMNPSEVKVELVAGPGTEQEFSIQPELVALDLVGKEEELHIYEGKFSPGQNGNHAYGVRVLPVIPGLGSPFETGLVLWG